MLKVKENPVGIDIPIQQLQEFLHARLKLLWQLADGKFISYGRCYRNRTTLSLGYVAENYEGGNEYKEVYFDDRFQVVSFFGVGSTIRRELSREKTSVHLVFFVNLKSLKPFTLHRADEDVRNDVIKQFQGQLFGFDLVSVETGLENVLREYPGSRREDRLKHVDMHPVHCFRLNFDLLYSINNCKPQNFL